MQALISILSHHIIITIIRQHYKCERNNIIITTMQALVYISIFIVTLSSSTRGTSTQTRNQPNKNEFCLMDESCIFPSVFSQCILCPFCSLVTRKHICREEKMKKKFIRQRYSSILKYAPNHLY